MIRMDPFGLLCVIFRPAMRSIAASGRGSESKAYVINATDDAIIAVQNGEMAAIFQQQPALQIETVLVNTNLRQSNRHKERNMAPCYNFGQ